MQFFYLFTREYCFSHYVAALFFDYYPIQASLSRLARVSDCRLCTSMGGECIRSPWRYSIVYRDAPASSLVVCSSIRFNILTILPSGVVPLTKS
jgi:hypothetical protein